MAETALLARCHWLLKARWAFVAALAGALALSDAGLNLQRHTAPLWAVAAFIAVYNAVFTAFERRPKFCVIGERRGVGERIAAFVFVQMALDALALTVLLAFSGGIENPVAFFYIFHVALAGILLSRRLCYALASLATALVVAVGRRAAELRFPERRHAGCRAAPAGVAVRRRVTLRRSPARCT